MADHRTEHDAGANWPSVPNKPKSVWDARVGRAMDVALPHELNSKAQWDLLRGFGLQLRDTYGAGLCVSLHHPNTKGDQRNVHGHIFMTSRAVDEEGNFSKTKIRSLDDRKLGPVEVERIREMWEVRCNWASNPHSMPSGASATTSTNSV